MAATFAFGIGKPDKGQGIQGTIRLYRDSDDQAKGYFLPLFAFGGISPQEAEILLPEANARLKVRFENCTSPLRSFRPLSTRSYWHFTCLDIRADARIRPHRPIPIYNR